MAMGAWTANGQVNPASPIINFTAQAPRYLVTNTVQFRTLSAKDDFANWAIRLRGVVTLVDTNRDLLVLQDSTGAAALHFDLKGRMLEAGQLVLVEATNCRPYVVGFPDYPYHPSGSETRTNFEGPTDWGEYYLSRMRGYLRAPATGGYTFWIASDNSSELWLSSSEDPSKVRRISFIPSFGWVNPHEWSRFPSQSSEPIPLEAGHTYYIEALQEQTTAGDNLSVAWQGPGLPRAIIDGRYLTPPTAGLTPGETSGILREYWTNYSAGDISQLASAQQFESAVSVQRAAVNILGTEKFPAASPVALSQSMAASDNFRWVQMEGVVDLVGMDGETAVLELSDGKAQIEARVPHWQPETARQMRNSSVRIEGVREGGSDQNGHFAPYVLWSPSSNFVSQIQTTGTNLAAITAAPSLEPGPTNGDTTMKGFYSASGVVTFNANIFGDDWLFVQEDASTMMVSLKERHFKNQLVVGQWVDLGGRLLPGKYIPTLRPLTVNVAGMHSLPEPMTQPVEFPIPGTKDGRWTEVEGVVRSVNTNGTMAVSGKDGPILVWIGQTSLNELRRYVDAKLRIRGVLSLTALESPVLLTQSRSLVDEEEAAPVNPFAAPVVAIGDLFSDHADYALSHRAKVRGVVIGRKEQAIFIQDGTGGVRVRLINDPAVKVGENVEVAGFPGAGSSSHFLTDALFRNANAVPPVGTKKLDLAETLSSKQACTLVEVTATVLNQKNFDGGQLLELQEQRRVFTAMLARDEGALPAIAPGSRVKITGVCDDGNSSLMEAGKPGQEMAPTGSLNIILRNAADVMVLSGPPWWTLKQTVALVGALFTVLVVTLLWVYLLRRRLERQQAARLAFSRQILEGQESERHRIAVNLHDSLGQNLLVIKNQARFAMQSAADETVRQERLNKISEIASEAIEEVRQITHDLRPYQLDRLGLTQAIRGVVASASENSSIQFASYLDDIDVIFDKESEIHVYRIVQEGLNNILKHSAANEAAVVVKNQAGSVSLSIRDNGHGFDAGPGDFVSSQTMGYGLSGIRERVRILGGEITIDSRPGDGTNITIEIPKPVPKS